MRIFKTCAYIVDHAHSAVHPIVHKTRLSRAGVTALVVLPWLISITYNMATGVAFSGFVGSACVSLNQLSGAGLDVFGVWTLVVEYLAPLLVMGACYARMITVLFEFYKFTYADDLLIIACVQDWPMAEI